MLNNANFDNTHKFAANDRDIYRLIFERSKDAVILTDGSLRILEANRAGCDLLGYDIKDIAGVKIIEIIHLEDHVLCPFLNDISAIKEKQVYCARVIKKDNAVINAELSIDKLADDILIISIGVSKNFSFAGHFTNDNKIENTLRASIDALPVWICCIDTEGKYFFANKYYASTFKIPLENIEGHNFKEFFPPLLYEKHKCWVDECLKTRRSITFEDEADFGNGLKAYLYGIYTPLLADDNTVYGLSAAVFDITAKKELELRINRALDDLRDSDEKYRALVENSICGIGMSQDDKIIYANRTLMKMYGYDDFNEFSSKKLIDYHPPESQKFLKARREKKNRGEIVPCEFEIDVIHKDGTLRTFLLNASEVKINNKNYSQTTFIDITERKKTEKKLQEWVDRYEYIVAASGQIAYDYNVATGEILWGSTIEKVLGYSLEEISGGFSQWVEMLHSEDKEEVLRKLSAAELNCSFFDAEYRLKHKDGHYVWVRDRGFFVADESGKAFKQLGMMEDIADRKMANDAIIKAKEQAEAASRAKSLFLANMSHEIRTPMNGIMGFTNLMGMSGLNDKQKEFNNIIKMSSTHLLGLINDILDFSKLEAKKLKLENSIFNIKNALNNSIKLVFEQAADKKIQIETYVDERITYDLNGDQLRFKQIIINLLTNAIKFTSAGKVGVNILQLSKSEDISTISIEVYDTGIGIPAEKTGEIFEMFHQLDDSTSKRHSGAGIGLSIVKGIVEMMNGTIKVESEVGKGSRFIVALPLKIADKEN